MTGPLEGDIEPDIRDSKPDCFSLAELAEAGGLAGAFEAFPAVRKSNTFTLDDAMAKMSEAASGAGHRGQRGEMDRAGDEVSSGDRTRVDTRHGGRVYLPSRGRLGNLERMDLMRSNTMRLGILALALLGSAAVAAAADEAPVDEGQLATKEMEVHEKLLEKGGAAAAAVRVRMDGTTAILTGTVRTQAALELAKEVALSVEGVKKVDNRLKLESGTSPRTDDKELADGWLEAKVKRRLFSDIGSHARRLEVEAVDGVVSVRGTLDNAERRDLAVKSIQSNEGVKKFVNLIDVKP